MWCVHHYFWTHPPFFCYKFEHTFNHFWELVSSSETSMAQFPVWVFMGPYPFLYLLAFSNLARRPGSPSFRRRNGVILSSIPFSPNFILCYMGVTRGSQRSYLVVGMVIFSWSIIPLKYHLCILSVGKFFYYRCWRDYSLQRGHRSWSSSLGARCLRRLNRWFPPRPPLVYLLTRRWCSPGST